MKTAAAPQQGATHQVNIDNVVTRCWICKGFNTIEQRIPAEKRMQTRMAKLNAAEQDRLIGHGQSTVSIVTMDDTWARKSGSLLPSSPAELILPVSRLEDHLWTSFFFFLCSPTLGEEQSSKGTRPATAPISSERRSGHFFDARVFLCLFVGAGHFNRSK